MANFADQIPSTAGPNYFVYSRGGEGLAVDASKGEFAKGLGALGTGAAEATDKALQIEIKKDVYDAADTLRDQWGNTDMVNRELSMPFDVRPPAQGVNASAVSTPDDVRGLGPKLDRLQQAKMAGKLENSDYWAQAESIVREMRARYPGYREVIDQNVSQVLGNTPANALHEAMMHELDRTATVGQQRAKEYQSFVKENIGYLPEDTQARLDSGNPYPLSQLYATVSRRKGAELANKAIESEIAARKAAGEDVERRAERSYVQNAQYTVQKTIRSMGEAAGFANYNDFTAFIQQRQKQGGGFNTEELARIQSYSSFLETNIRQALEASGSANLSKEPGQYTSYNQILQVEKLKAHNEQAMSPYLGYTRAVLGGNFQMAQFYQNLATNAENAVVAGMMQDPTIQQAFGVTKVLGREGMPLWLRQVDVNTGQSNLGSFSRALHDLGMWKSGFGGFKSTGDVVTTIKQQQASEGGNPADPAPYKAAINDRVRMITDPQGDPNMKANYIKEMYGPDNKDFLKKFADTPKAPRSELFTQLTSPQVSDAVFNAAKTDPGLWTNYRNWAAQSFVSQFHADGSSLGNAMSTDPTISVSWDPGAKQFDVVPNPNYKGPGVMTPEAVASSGAKAAADRINNQIRTMDYILSKDGRDSGAEFQKLFAAMGINTGAQGPQMPGEQPLTPPGSTKPVGKTGETGAQTKPAVDVPGAIGRGVDAVGGAIKGAVEGYTERNRQRYGTGSSQFAPESSRAYSGAQGAIQEAIHGAESKAAGGYDAVVGEKKGFSKPTEMTVNDVLKFQASRIGEGKNTAIGAYQITNATLKGLVKTMGLTGDEQFTPELQDKMFDYLLQRRGADDYLNDRIDDKTFARNLSQEWAGLPKDGSGKSFYDGVNGNKANADYGKVLSAIRAFKANASVSF